MSYVRFLPVWARMVLPRYGCSSFALPVVSVTGPGRSHAELRKSLYLHDLVRSLCINSCQMALKERITFLLCRIFLVGFSSRKILTHFYTYLETGLTRWPANFLCYPLTLPLLRSTRTIFQMSGWCCYHWSAVLSHRSSHSRPLDLLPSTTNGQFWSISVNAQNKSASSLMFSSFIHSWSTCTSPNCKIWPELYQFWKPFHVYLEDVHSKI